MKEWGRGVEVVLLAWSWKLATIALLFVASFAGFQIALQKREVL